MLDKTDLVEVTYPNMRALATSLLIAASIYPVIAQQNSSSAKWEEKWTETTGSRWRTKVNSETGESISYDTKTSELWTNPRTGKTEAVLIEGKSEQQSNVAENPVLPSEAANWSEVFNEKSSSRFRTYTNSKTGETVSADVVDGEFWRNPNTGQTEVVLKERVQNSVDERKAKIRSLEEQKRKLEAESKELIEKELSKKSKTTSDWEAARERAEEKYRAALAEIEETRRREAEELRQRQEQIRQQRQQPTYSTPSYNGYGHGPYYGHGYYP